MNLRSKDKTAHRPRLVKRQIPPERSNPLERPLPDG